MKTRQILLSTTFAVLVALPAFAQQPQQTPSPPPPDDPLMRVTVPTVTVTAQKEPEDLQKLPVSVTAVTEETIERAGIHIVSDAAIYAPNTVFTEFTARKLSNARFRGIGASPANPAITTFIDGVPQLNGNSTSYELLDVQQIEFVRGPQSSLFGRNTLGGLVNVTSRRPSGTKWTGDVSIPFGNYSMWDLRGSASGPVGETLSASGAFSYANRDGFTINTVTGDDLDYRSAFTVKGQLQWNSGEAWDARVIVTGEHARDGDYGLQDLATLRANPFESSRNFEGHTDRDIFATTIQARRKGALMHFESTTGFVNWSTRDVTDLDYTAAPILIRDNPEDDFQFTQEFRVSSATPKKLSDTASLNWQAGMFLFTQNYEQDAFTNLAPFVLSPLVPVAVDQHSRADLDDFGLGFFGQGTVNLSEKLDLIGGLRFDYEDKSANLDSFLDPPLFPGTTVSEDNNFSNVSPQVSVTYRLKPEYMVYGTVGSGYKAGGFNAAAPVGNEAYDEEHTWQLEGGVKTTWAQGRVAFNVAAFYIDWSNLQLNLPNPNVPAQVYIANVGDAASSGFELEVNSRPAAGIDVFGSFGYTHARFSDGSISLGVPVAGNDIPNTPDYTLTMGVQYGRVLTPSMTLYARGEIAIVGAFKYDDLNLQGQDAYSLTNFRGGVRGKLFFAEAWVKNAFDTFYIPVAFQFDPNLAASGYLGEAGAPRTFGISAGVTF
jgi:iron complex outermembrane receptor protein